MRYHPALAPIRTLICALLLGLALPLVGADSGKTPVVASEKKDPYEELAWKEGPMDGNLRDRATIKVPKGFRFLEHEDAAKLTKLSGNRSSGRELGFLENTKEEWAVFFQFDDSGYVKDDEKNSLDADALMESFREGSKSQNEYRKKQGYSAINVIDWHVKPNYNDQTKNLEWSLLLESDGERFVNYNIKLLGRRGVTEVTLVDSLGKVDATLPEFRSLLKGFSYSSGESYSEFKSGDKISEYGLTALVLGGAAAVGYKVGFFGMLLVAFKKFAKLIIFGVVAVVAGIKKFFGNLFGGRRPPSDGSSADS
jgi:uncharacterized membrane-anchored protein